MKDWLISKCNKNQCTCWFDSFGKWSWGECCTHHDVMYIHRSNHDISKKEIDTELYKCVSSKTCKLFGAIMWLGNKAFSWYAWRMYK